MNRMMVTLASQGTTTWTQETRPEQGLCLTLRMSLYEVQSDPSSLA